MTNIKRILKNNFLTDIIDIARICNLSWAQICIVFNEFHFYAHIGQPIIPGWRFFPYSKKYSLPPFFLGKNLFAPFFFSEKKPCLAPFFAPKKKSSPPFFSLQNLSPPLLFLVSLRPNKFPSLRVRATNRRCKHFSRLSKNIIDASASVFCTKIILAPIFHR